jgi:type II secretion system protein G
VGSGLYGSLEMYRMHVGDYPSNLADLLARPADPRQAALWRGRYLRDDSRLDDGWGRALIYVYPGVRNAGTFDLFSVGADGVAGTADDIE